MAVWRLFGKIALFRLARSGAAPRLAPLYQTTK
jgi:hypothetical protein